MVQCGAEVEQAVSGDGRPDRVYLGDTEQPAVVATGVGIRFGVEPEDLLVGSENLAKTPGQVCVVEEGPSIF